MSIQAEIRKTYGDFKLDIKLDSSSKRIGILGASGCGKSMTLKSIAGIEQPDSGRICIEGRPCMIRRRRLTGSHRSERSDICFKIMPCSLP